MNMNKLIDPFQIEESRKRYAQDKNEIEFKKLYSQNVSSISNKNSRKLWDGMLGNSLNTRDPMTRDRIKKTASIIKAKKNMSILDIGIGDAWVEIEFQKRHKDFSLTGVDIASESLKKIEGKFIQFESIISDIEKLEKKLNRRKYDCILALEIFEHIDAWKILKIQKSLKKLLKKNGQLIISVPTNEDLAEKILREENYSAHVRRYTPEVIKFELNLSGYNIEKEFNLFAFSNFYKFKTMIAKVFNLRQPNVVILDLAKK